MEKVGEEYLNALISRSFFQQSSEDELALIMHDLVHDLATRVSSQFCCVLDDHKDSSNLPNKTRHFSYSKYYKDNIKLEGLFNAKCLRTLLALPLMSYRYASKLVLMENVKHELLSRDGRCLRALSLSQFDIKELPESIDNLKHLRYLDLSNLEVTKLPDSICTLYNLQTLLLSYCLKLTQLPIKMSNLISLRHLDIRGTPLKEMPPYICNMTNLQTLSDFVLGESDGSRIKELEKLHLSRGSLQINGLQNVVDIGHVQKASLKKKKGLTELILRWDITSDADSLRKEKEMEVLDALEPEQSYLKKLKIIGYKGINFSNWVAHHSYHNLVKVTLSECKNCCSLPLIGQLPSLKRLKIRGFDQVTSIGDAFCGTSSLEDFSIEDMNLLEKWSFTEANQEDKYLIFPRLKKLSLHNCKKIKVALPASYLPSLKTIDISSCDEMVTVFPISNHRQIDTTYPSLQSLTLIGCLELESFSKMGVPSNLKQLYIARCEMLLANLICQIGKTEVSTRNRERLAKIQHIPHVRIDYMDI